MKNQLFASIVLIMLLSSCFQISSLQTGRTLPKGDTNLGAAIDVVVVADSEGGGVIPIPNLEIFARRGIAQNFDAGLKLSTAGSLSFNGKYQFYGDQTSKFASAVGAVFEVQYDGHKYFTTHQTLALYLSAHPNENFAWYVTPKFIHKFENVRSDGMFIGVNIGMQKRINPRFVIVGEASILYAFDGGLLTSAGVGFVFNLK